MMMTIDDQMERRETETKYFGYFGLIRGESSARHIRKCPAISCCPVQQAVVVGCDITRSRGSIWKRHEEVIQGSFEGFRGDAALH